MKYNVIKKSQNFKNFEVVCTFFKSNLYIIVNYDYSKKDFALESIIVGNSIWIKEANEYTTFINLFYETQKEEEALEGFTSIQKCNYTGTSVVFTPFIKAKDWKKSYKATKLK
jgi:hypothetical protein